MENEMIPFNDKRELGQNQYASRYIDGRHDYAKMGVGLRIDGDPEAYHTIMIHKDDWPVFLTRVLRYKKLCAEGLYDQAENWARLCSGPGAMMATESHYHFLDAFYGLICKRLKLTDTYRGRWSSNGDKIYQYRHGCERFGIPWFHTAAMYMLMDSHYRREVRDTDDGWVKPATWMIHNYTEGHNFKTVMHDLV